MKRLWTLFIHFCATAVFLAACGSSPVVEEVALAEEVEPAVNPVPVEPETAVEPIDPFDLSLIGATGRPQFLNAYASW